jgi:SAM-dependent methyltransferase
MPLSPAARADASSFDDADMARCYQHRPPYAPALYDFLLGLVPTRRRLLDLGCGPGKIAGALADRFDEVLALDPSGPMIAAGREAYGRRHPNIRWLQSRVEDAFLDAGFDLVTAGASLHWMDHEVLFPRLADLTPVVAAIGGDEPGQVPWREEWRALNYRWLERVGRTPDPAGRAAAGSAHEAWLDIAGRKEFDFTWRQPVEDFIACQHSRAAWSRAAMGEVLAQAFDRDIATTLAPWTEDGILTLAITSHLTWGAPRSTPHTQNANGSSVKLGAVQGPIT